MIKLQKVSIKQGDFSIEDVSLHVPAGCYAGLMGKSGCGKTSLLEAIAGLRPICSGTVTLNDQDVTHLKPCIPSFGLCTSGSSPISQHARWKAAGLFTRSAIHVTSRDRSENSRIKRFAFSRSFTESLPGWLERRRSSTRRLGTSACQSAQNTVPGRTPSALDEGLHEELCELLQSIHKELNMTILHVTHSRPEAERLAEKIWHFKDHQVQPVD